MSYIYDKEKKKTIYKRLTPQHNYKVYVDSNVFDAKNIKDLCKIVNNEYPDLFNLTDWKVYNLLKNKYTGKQVDKWKRIKIIKVLDSE